ncbi:MAG: redoxin domain-containing protein [Chloroflexi bacterium]|nr:redoxin domain-containing protein [Chloroflexota bacterium]
MQRSQAELDAAGVQILAISTDNLDGPAALAAAQGYEFPILFTSLDPEIPKQYGVFNLFGDGLASASVFLIDTNGEIVWQNVGLNYTHQVEAEEIIEQIEKLG